MNRFYDNTRISSFTTCPRMYYYRHVRHWKPIGIALPLVFGAAWHKAMDVVWLAYDEPSDMRIKDEDVIDLAYTEFIVEWTKNGLLHPDEMDKEDIESCLPRAPQVAQEMLYHYVELRRSFIQEIELLEIEKPFAVPLDPSDPTLFYVGRKDKVVRHAGDVIVPEHKTTAYYKKNGPFRSIWIDNFSPDRQIGGYTYSAMMEYGAEMDSVWIDAALVHKTVHDGFRWIPIKLLDSDLDLWLWQTNNTIQEIEANVEALKNCSPNESYMAAFEQRTNSCIQYNRACPYLGICKTWTNPIGEACPDGYEKDKWDPFKELDLSSIGLEKESI